jgi:hypothetical protein
MEEGKSKILEFRYSTTSLVNNDRYNLSLLIDHGVSPREELKTLISDAMMDQCPSADVKLNPPADRRRFYSIKISFERPKNLAGRGLDNLGAMIDQLIENLDPKDDAAEIISEFYDKYYDGEVVLEDTTPAQYMGWVTERSSLRGKNSRTVEDNARIAKLSENIKGYEGAIIEKKQRLKREN